ncbi:LysR family transcriptional regulator [Brumicola nitratireducens]|uniref:LysR family transcriptional regulator n=1 Tax=Glaciecola nitratireducens (strain JCM 12485 / KCTC 12276 / FR1064) TaxID=1085623 RepID=G4QFP0_GLANF|nr:LysR family transcriptional regulator [Glaciecola nitratireducens]AEP28825.1 LysR family transcriptional regulator [Glaciecola nitratireducens FR1064]
MINQTLLKTFCTLVENGHFTRTADRLAMTQSGVSQHIKKLEQQLEVPLLIREGKSFSLTNAGEQLYHQGNELLKSSEDLERLIKHDEPHEGVVKFSSPGSIGLRLYPFLLSHQSNHPNLIIDYTFAPNKNIEQALAERKIDLGLLTDLTKVNNLISKKIAVEPLVLVTPKNITSVDWKQLIQLGFIAHPDAAHHGRLLLSENFSEFEHVKQFTHKGFSNQISLILEPVSRGFGFTVLPLHAAKAFHQQGLIRIHHLNKPVNENLYLCFNRQAIKSNRIKYIESYITSYLAA